MHFDEAMNESNVRFFMGTSAQRSTTLGKLHYCLVCVGRSALSKTRSIQSLHSFTFRGHNNKGGMHTSLTNTSVRVGQQESTLGPRGSEALGERALGRWITGAPRER